LALKANKILLTAIKLCVSSALLYYLFERTGLTQILRTLSNINIIAFIAAIVLYVFAQVVSTLRWKLLLPQGIGLKKLFSLYMIGAFFNSFLPGIIGGDAVKGFYLYKTTGKVGLALASVFMDRYIGLVVLIAICAVAFPFGYQYLHGSDIEWILLSVILSFVLGSFLFFGLRIGQRIKHLADLYHYFYLYRNEKGTIGKALLLSVLVQFSGFSAVYILACGLGQNIPFLSILVYLPLIILISMIPISISGLGVREGAFVLFFGFIGVKPEAAAAISLSWFVSASAGSLIGLIEYVKYKKEENTISIH
jgi:glycosyltransferase 2 family protein